MDMLAPPLGRAAFYACSSVIDGNSAHLSPRFDKCKTENLFSCLPQRGEWAQRLQKHGHHQPEESEATMPLKPNGALCRVREQIIEDAPSGLTLQFECEDGRLRLLIAGRALPMGNREILFDAEGRESAAGTLVGEFRRPSWLKAV
jgi:hypothetical protein